MKKGFTLIELLIVVAIIAILAAIAVPNFLEAQTRSKVSRAKADMRSIATALESYRVDSNKYPPMADWNPGEGIDYWNWSGSGSVAFHARLPNFITTPLAYITSLPGDIFIPTQNPVPFSSARYPASSGVGLRYVYFNYDNFAQPDPNVAPSVASQKRSVLTGGWVFYSFGPDRVTNQAEPPNGVFLRYDPTNGTVSLGNIVRTAGSSEGRVQQDTTLTTLPNGPN